MGSKLRVVSLNVNDLRDRIKQKWLRSLLHTLKPEVVLLQDTHISSSGKKVLGDRSFSYQFHSKGSPNARGTAILIHKSIRFEVLAVKKDDKGRFLAVKGKFNGETVTLFSVYVPNFAQVSFLEEIFRSISEFGEGTIIVAGGPELYFGS